MTQEKHRMRRDQKIKLIVGIIIFLLAIAALWFGFKWLDSRNDPESGQFGDHGDWGNGNTQTAEPKIVTLDGDKYEYTDDLRSYLLIGTDATGEVEPQEGRGDMADFIMLFFVNRTKDTYGFIQFNRDTITDVPILDKDGKNIGTYPEQLCISHWYGRTDEERNTNTVNTVSQLLGGLEIDGYYAIDMKDVGALNDAIGGVLVTIDEDMTKVDPDFKEGAEILLTDDQAEKYLRARKSVGEGTNEERMDRQYKYMQAAYNRVINQLREEPNYINTLYDELQDQVKTDQTNDRLSEFAKYISKGSSLGFLRLDGKTTEGDTLGTGQILAEHYLSKGAVKTTLSSIVDLKPSQAADPAETDTDDQAEDVAPEDVPEEAVNQG
ncbi:MAG: LytR family transcriptional regulator [Clostridiales bacterium]|nr:LytR family transcriptional regulator [Clostridiales bacterium]